jgi:hypothetical protein
MAVGSFKVAIQKGQWGFFAEVTLEATPDANHVGVDISFDPVLAQNWQLGARFGVNYAWENTPTFARPFSGIRVVVQEIHGMPIDTTDLTVAFAAMNAFWKAIGACPRQQPSLDTDSRSVRLPK